MKVSSVIGAVVGTWLVLTGPAPRRDQHERGGSEVIAQVLLCGLAIAVVAIAKSLP
jgi:hypothetical protein